MLPQQDSKMRDVESSEKLVTKPFPAVVSQAPKACLESLEPLGLAVPSKCASAGKRRRTCSKRGKIEASLSFCREPNITLI